MFVTEQLVHLAECSVLLPAQTFNACGDVECSVSQGQQWGLMKVRSCITRTLFVLLIAAATAPALLAQSLVSGDLTGTVTDPSGAVVSGATVTLKSVPPAQAARPRPTPMALTDFLCCRREPTTSASLPSGFSKSDTVVNVSVGQASISDLKLAVGASSQTSRGQLRRAAGAGGQCRPFHQLQPDDDCQPAQRRQ